MVTMEDIYQAYEDAEIPLFFEHGADAPAVTVKLNDMHGVFINFFCYHTVRDQKGAMIHEKGHADTGTTHAVNSPLDLVGKHEFIAKKSSWLEWMSPEEIEEAFHNGCRESWEFANWFDLPEENVDEALRYYLANECIELDEDEDDHVC